jgi:hypothetical protein
MFATRPVRKRLCGEKLKVNIIMCVLGVISIEEDDDPDGNETIQGTNQWTMFALSFISCFHFSNRTWHDTFTIIGCSRRRGDLCWRA